MDPGWDGPTDRRRSYSVEVAGVGGPRNRPGRTAALALVLVVALVGGGILSSQLSPAQHVAVAPSALPVALSSPSASAAAATPVPSAPLTMRVTADPVDISALVAVIPRRGTGTLAFVDGRLHSTQRKCEPGAPLSACLVLRIDGLRGAKVVPDDAIGTWPGDPPQGETLVLLPRDGVLVYLGSLLVDAAGIPRIDALTAAMASPSAGKARLLPSLHEADGLLLNDVSPCVAGAPCATGGPVLLAVPPSIGQGPDLVGAVPVRIMDSAFGVGIGDIWVTGPFLLRIRTDSATVAWDVVAREDQGSILHVVIP